MRWISGLWAGALIAAAAREGADAEALAAVAGVSLSDPNLVEERISEAKHLATWAAVMRALDDPAFPIRFGRSLAPDAYDALGLATKTARDLAEALDRVARYLHIWTNTVSCDVHVDGDRARVALTRKGTRDLAMRCANESAVAEIVHAMRSVADTDVPLRHAYFSHARPTDTREHDAWFACPLSFDATFDGVELDRTLLDAPLRLADAGLSRFLVDHLEGLAKKRLPEPTFAEEVAAVVADALPEGRPTAPAIAGRLGVSTRTLQRRLHDEDGCTLNAVIERTRRRIAEELLADVKRPLAEVAFLCGYSEPSAFFRAFKAWTQMTPSAFRSGLPARRGTGR